MTVWARVRDISTGHHFDLQLSDLDRLVDAGVVEEIPGRRHRSSRPRRPKALVRLDGRPATPGRRPAEPKE